MHLLLSVVILSAGAIILAWAYGAHRRPVPAAWTRYDFLSSLVCLLVTCLLPLGIGFGVSALIDPATTLAGLNAWTVGGCVLAIGLWWLLVPRLMAPARQAAVSTADIVPFQPDGPRNTPPVSKGGGHARRRKAA
jgi:hypothetical protein